MPAVLLYTVFIVYSMLTSFGYSFTDFDGVGTTAFTGLSNYIKLFTHADISGHFYLALWHNIYIFIVNILISTPLALYFAYAIDRKVRGYVFYRNVIFFPQIVSNIAVGFLFMLVFEPNIGLINNFLIALGLDKHIQPWLGLENVVLNVIIGVVIWKSIGVTMMLYLANIQSIPTECMEAAKIDGASDFTKFIHIVFPLLAPSFTINVVLTFIGSLGVFDLVYSIAGPRGEPNYCADVITTFYYRYAFTAEYGSTPQVGFATAIAVVMFLIVLAATAIQLKILRRREIEY